MSLVPVFKIGLWNAWLPMSVFLLQMLVIMAGDHRIMEKSHVPAEAKHQGLEKHTGSVANAVWMLALIYSVFLPLQPGFPFFFDGLAVFAAGLILLIIATANFLTTPVDRLITQGAYRFSRHPMYLATLLICLGTGLAAASWIFLVLAVLMFLCFRLEAGLEERYCLEKYGDTYREYAGRTPRWLGLPKRGK